MLGPSALTPCGIADYVGRLAPALASRCRLEVLSYADGWERAKLAQDSKKNRIGERNPDVFLLHYERMRVPGPTFMRDMAKWVGDRLYVVPHEVYSEDPFAFPESQLGAPWPLIYLQRALYRWRHRSWVSELALQRRGYGARAVFPLNRVAAEILRRRNARVTLEVIPLARGKAEAAVLQRPGLRPPGMKWLWAVAGFLTPGNDYEALFAALRELPDQGLLLAGGLRPDGPQDIAEELRSQAEAMGVGDRVIITGYVAEADLPGTLAAADGFLCPFKFRSASASILQALACARPVLAADLPMTREMLEEGAPLILIEKGRWREVMAEVAEGLRVAPKDQYRWTVETVAEAYLKAIQASAENQ